MMYIQLSENYKDFDKVKINEIHFYDSTSKISFKYQIYKNEGSEYIELFDKMISISEGAVLDSILNFVPVTGTKIKDGISKVLLQYLLDSNIENGTLEIKQ